MNTNENNNQSTWKKVLNFIVKLIELVIATFFGANLADKVNLF